MKSQEKSLIQEFTMFDTYMSDIYYPGWEESLEQDQISWHWIEYWTLIARKEKEIH
jgi:hypothetical protein